jgi:Spy/CpxP family protein refolding chaperone
MSPNRWKHFVVLLAAAVAVLTTAAPALAQAGPPGPPPAGVAGPPPHPFAHLLHCLAVVNLTDAQKADVRAVLEAAKPEAEAIAAALKADREALRAELEKTPPDPCTVGSAALQLHADRLAAKALFEKTRDAVLAVLTPEQKAKLAGCLEAPKGPATLTAGGGDEPAM